MIWKNKKILITGGNGFVGYNAANYFSKLGASVTIVTHKNTNNLKNLHENVSILSADLLNPVQARKVLKNQQIVLNCAALDGSLEYKRNHSADLFSANTRLNLNMFESAVKNNVEVFLLLSSADIYTTSDNEITEKTPVSINWDQKVDGYKLAKWVSELASREFSDQYGLNTIIVRPSNLYGPYDEFMDIQRLRFIPSVITKAFNKNSIEIWGNGQQSRSFLYIDDLLFMCRRLIEEKYYNVPINLAGNQPISLNELSQTILKLAKKEVEITIDPNKPGGPLLRSFNLEKLRSVIGDYTETDYQIGLTKTIKHYKKHFLYEKK